MPLYFKICKSQFGVAILRVVDWFKMPPSCRKEEGDQAWSFRFSKANCKYWQGPACPFLSYEGRMLFGLAK
jgi:hypothetical protein